MTLVKFQPAPAHNSLDFRSPYFGAGPLVSPAVNVIESPQGFRIELAAPGLAKEDFQVKIEENLLTISAQKEAQNAENGAQYRRREFAFTTFRRVFQLPDTVDTDSVQAAFENGILRVELTKKPEAQPFIKTIEIA